MILTIIWAITISVFYLYLLVLIIKGLIRLRNVRNLECQQDKLIASVDPILKMKNMDQRVEQAQAWLAESEQFEKELDKYL